ncbi:hypothetical protein VTN00DRAFT_6333 [Thermoascus crustaceus]|uniref:uncharacterized protein n=1 Tax=Thermoascus crustaceus TaxID=5088 RepID=UPI003744976E
MLSLALFFPFDSQRSFDSRHTEGDRLCRQTDTTHNYGDRARYNGNEATQPHVKNPQASRDQVAPVHSLGRIVSTGIESQTVTLAKVV